MNNKKIFITGGAGYIGKKLISKYYENNDITVYSRDEAKHYYLKKKYPKVNFIVGDVRDFDLMLKASKNHNIGIFAASMKQIESVDQNYEEAIKTIVLGSVNSRRVVEENCFEAACFISSDKSRSPTTLYGGMKFVAGELFIVNSNNSPVRLSTAIYGNVLNSTGSVIPLIWDSINNNYELKLYHKDMTRFFIDADEAVKLIESSLTLNGYNVIPNLKSMRILDLFELFSNKFGLRYSVGVPRISEKLHELLISPEEINRTFFDEKLNCYKMHYKNLNENKISITHLSSEDVVISKNDLDKLLQKYNYFK